MQLVIFIAAGVSLLLSGIFLMRLGLKKMLSNRIKCFFTHLTVTPWRGLFVGIFASAVMQSSTAVSLIAIGFVAADYLTFYQSLGIILGANIGTCTTVQLLTLSIPKDFLFPLLGLCLFIMITTKRLKYVAMPAAGLTAMFLGLNILSQSVGEISQLDHILHCLMTTNSDPIYGIFSGAIITMLFQSSSAATGVLMVLVEKGLNLTTAAYIVYGNNIGSCISSVIVGAAAPIAAKRVAAAHIVLNILGVLVFLPATSILVSVTSYLSNDFAEQVALIHTIFNIISSLAVMPIIRYYAKLIIFLVPENSH